MDDLIETLEAKGGFDTLIGLLDMANLTEMLQGPGPFTLFGPDDDAWDRLNPNTMRLLTDPRNRHILTQVLLFHVGRGEFLANDLIGRSSVPSLNGEDLDLTLKRSGLFVEKSQVVEADILASNGVLHVINAPMFPNLADTRGDVGAISDDLAGILNSSSNNSTRTVDLDKAAGDQVAGQAEGTPDIVDALIADGNFNTLVGLVQIAGLEEALRLENPLTVLAPTDDAFDKIDGAVLRNLVENRENGVLRALLLYHVIPDSLDSTALASLDRVQTVLGRPVFIQARGRSINLNNSSDVVNPDISARNGFIHGIDTPLSPE
ncbi:MAG: fasciclin domain-containing protein [Planctomycetota bacterium]